MRNIRPATPADCETILGFIQELAIYEKLEHEAVGTSEALLDHLFGEQPVIESLIAEWDGVPVGFALFFRTYSTFLTKPGIYLEDLYVQPDFRGKGLGKALFIELAKLTVERGYGRYEWSVLDWNQPSIDFYVSMGAQPMDEWKKYRLDGDSLCNLANPSASDPPSDY